VTEFLAFAGVLESAIPIVAIVLVFGIPIVAILSAHQRRMAELMHQRGNNTDAELTREVLAMRREITELRDRVNALTVASDVRPSLSASSSSSAPSQENVREISN